MKRKLAAALGTVLAAGSIAGAEITLQMDINAIGVQVKDAAGVNSAFGGLSHTGSVNFSMSAFGFINAISVQSGNATPVNQNFSGSLVDFDGAITLTNGLVTGGNLLVTIDSGDTYSADIVSNVGMVTNFVGGGFKVEGLTFNGKFSDPMFGNVDVTEWFLAQNLPNLLTGSFLQFNFDPNAQGAGFADMDLFVVVPLPPAAWAGLATLGCVMTVGYIRRRRR